MTSIADSRPELPAEEELVAYLDGELSPEACRRVEARLAADESYRKRLHELDQAWEALAALPDARAGDDLARTTMELVTVAAADDVSRHGARATAGRRRIVWWAAGCIAAGVVGFIAARVLLSRSDAAILSDLPVIQHVDVLTQIEDVDFLRRIAPVVSRESLGEEMTAGEPKASPIFGETRDARRQWIEQLPPDEKTALAGRAKRFGELPEAEQRRVRALHQEILAADDAAELQRTLAAYAQWLAELSPGEQEQLREELWELPAGEQADLLRRYAREEREQAARRLSTEDAERLRETVREIVEDRQQMLLDKLGERGAADWARRLEGPRGALVILSQELQQEGAANEARERLVDALSPEARAHLEKLGRWNRRLPRQQLWQWIRDAMYSKLGAGDLEKFFTTELSNSQRERLLNLPPGEMQAELERLYLANDLGFRGGEPFGPPGNRPGPGGANPRPDFGPRDQSAGPPPPPPDGPPARFDDRF